MADVGFYTQAQPNALFGTAAQAVGVRNAQAQNALLGVDIQQSQQNLGQQQLQYLAGNLGAMATDPNLTAGQMHAFAQNAVKEGLLNPSLYQVESSNIDAAGNDPGKLRALAASYSKRALDSLNQYAATYGYGPGQGASPVNVPATDAQGNPTGATATIPLSQFAGQASGSQQPGNPFTAHPATAGGNQITGQTAPADQAAPPVPLAPQKQFVGPSPQQQAQFTASAAQQQADVTGDADYQANIVPIKKVLSLLPEVPLFGSGAEIPTEVSKVLATYGVPQAALQSKDSSEIEKYLAGIARASGAAPNAVAQLEQSITANPNMSSDRLAAKDVLATQLAFARLQHLKVAALGNLPPEQYSDKARKWASTQDVRALAFDLMDDKAKAALRGQLDADPKAAAKFVATYNSAKQAGIFDQ